MKRLIFVMLLVAFMALPANAKGKSAHKDMTYHGAKKVVVSVESGAKKVGCSAYRFVRFVL